MKYFFLLMLCSNSFAGEFLISEDSLLKLVRKSNPSIQSIETTFYTSQVTRKEARDMALGASLYMGQTVSKTKEKAIIPFQPVFGDTSQLQIGVKKYTKYGVVLDLNTSIDRRTSDSGSTEYTNLTTIKHKATFQFDLWKNFMGRVTRAQLDNLDDIVKKDTLQKNISKNVFLNNTRKIYWSLVANEQKIKITNKLLKIAKKQYRDAKKRKANSISDKAEVASFASLVHQRRGSLLLLDYQRENIYKTLRNLFPALTKVELKLEKYNVDSSIFKILACTAKIDKEKSLPLQYTQYDEVTNFLRGVQQRQKIIDRSYGDIDIAFELSVQKVGVGSELSGSNYEGSSTLAQSDMDDNDRSGISASVMVSIPFGENKSATVAIKDKLTEGQFSASIDKIDSNILATHIQIQRSIKLLISLIKEQRANSKELSIRVSELKKKYAQARIAEYVLIQDEGALLQSDVTVVETQLQIVNTVLDYFSVFGTYPCAFNRSL